MPGGGQQTTTQSQNVDPRFTSAVMENFDWAKGQANQPFQPYTTPRVAGASFQEEQGRRMMEQAALGRLGQQPLNSAVDAATGVSRAVAPQVQAQGGWAQTAGPAAQGRAQVAPWNVERVQAPTVKDAVQTPFRQILNPTMIEAKTADPFHAATAARIDRGAVRDLRPGRASDPGAIAAYRNPHEQQVIDAFIGDADRARRITLGDVGARASAAGAFGGSRHALLEAETNRGFADTTARTSAQLRADGFDRAADLFGRDQALALQAEGANQGIDLNVVDQNAGFGQQTGIVNAAAANAREQFNARQRHEKNLANQDWKNRTNIVDLEAGMGIDQFNARQVAEVQQGNIRNELAALTGNADWSNRRNDSIADKLQQMELTNIGARDRRDEFNTDKLQQMEIFNAGQRQNAGFQQQDAILRMLGINLQGADLLGGLGQRQREFGFGDAQMMSGAGQMDRMIHQGQLDAAYEDFLRAQQFPYQQAQLRNSALGFMGSAFPGSTSTRGPSNNPGLFGMLGQLGAAAIMRPGG